jgi:hypothetical protein
VWAIRWCAVAVVLAFANAAVAHADPIIAPIECPNTHTHVWHREQCDDLSNPFGIPGSGHGGSCGIVCGIGKLLGGLGGLL